MKQKLLLALLALFTLGGSNLFAQTDVTSTYLTNADFSSTEGWTLSASSQYHDQGNGLIGTYGVRTAEGQAVSTVDDTHLATEYCFGFEVRWSTNFTSYYQETKELLPIGFYTLTFDVENTNPQTTNATYDNLFYVQVGEVKITDNSTEWMKGKSSWTTHTIQFDITEAAKATISLGYGTGSNNIGSRNTPTLHVSHLKLTFKSALDVAKEQWEAAKQEANNTINNDEYKIVTGQERTDLQAEINKAEPTTVDGYKQATNDINTAVTAFTTAKNSYQTLADYIELATTTGSLQYADASKKPVTNVEATSASDADEKAATLISALRAYVESNSIAEGVNGHKDYTSYIKNPDATDGNNNWTWTGSKNDPRNNEPWTDSEGNSSHYYFDGGNWGANSWTTTMQQDILLPPGKYLLAAKGRASTNVTFTMKAGEQAVNMPKLGNAGNVFDRGWNDAVVEFTSDGLTNTTILVSASANAIHEWFSISNFRLTQLEEHALSDEVINALIETIPEGKMNANVQQTLNQAKNNLQTEKSVDAYNALADAITAANNSIAAYTAANEKLIKMKAIVESTNVFAAEADNTYYTQWADKYEDNTLTDEEANALVDPNATTGWRAESPEVSKFLISAWDAELNDWDGLHVNTWSAAGDFGETGFAVPLTEYWVGSGSLAAKTMTATISNVEAGNYKVSANMFVKATSVPTGISMQVGDAEAAAVTGTQNGDFFVSEATAFGTVGEDGNLVIKLIVAEGNNTNWIGFKNMKYEKVNVDYAALNAAIATANAVNATINGGVKALTDAIDAAQELLTSADQNAIDEAVTTLNAATETAKTTITARKNLAGVAKKAAALKGYLENDITEDIAAATEYAANAEATAEEAGVKADALNANFEEWEVVTLNNSTFDTGLNGELIEPGTAEKPYVHAVDGWTQNFKFSSTASQGIAAAYGSAAQNGTNGTAAPVADMFGKSEGGALHLSSGWSDQARYYQEVKDLPAGKYVFYYEGINVNNTTNALNANYFGIGNLTTGDIEGTNDSFKFSDEKNFTYNEWKAVAFDFTLTKTIASANINVGLIGGTTGSGTTPKMWFDNVTIYCISTTQMATAEDYAALNTAIEAAEAKTLGFNEGEFAPYNNVDAIKALATAKEINQDAENSKEVVLAAISAIADDKWTANTEEMNAIYDGTLKNAPIQATSENVVLPGWVTKSGNIRQTFKGTEENGKAALADAIDQVGVFVHPGTYAYGETEGYTMPLKDGVVYRAEAKYCAWTNASNNNFTLTILKDGETIATKSYGANQTACTEAGALKQVYLYFTPEENGNYVLNVVTDGNTFMTDFIIKRAVVEDVTLLDAATEAPAEAYANVTYNRQLLEGWNSLVLPFDVTKEELGINESEAENGERVLEYKGTEKNGESDYTLKFDRLTGNVLAANTPYLIKKSANGESMQFSGKIISPVDEPKVADETGAYDFVGTYVAIAKDENKIKAGDLTVGASQLNKAKAAKAMKAFRAFFRCVLPAEEALNARITVNIDGQETDAITAVEIFKTMTEGIYNLQGQKVNKAQKGVYIVNGKKIVVR